jgi:hypothetical protein
MRMLASILSRASLLAALLAALLPALFTASALAAPATDPKVLAAGRALSDQFEQGQTAAIFARMTASAKEAVGGSAAGFAEFRERVLREDGPETGVIVEETLTAGGNRIYRRIARRNVGETPTLMEWTLDPKDRVVELTVRPQPVAIPSGKVGY